MDSNVVCKYSMFKVAGNSMDNGKRGSFEKWGFGLRKTV